MENLYDIIGVSPSVSDEELDSAYKKLREKYGEERFQNGPAGEEAADKLEKLERAYSENRTNDSLLYTSELSPLRLMSLQQADSITAALSQPCFRIKNNIQIFNILCRSEIKLHFHE